MALLGSLCEDGPMRGIWKGLQLLGLLIAALAAVLSIRAAGLTSRQLAVPMVLPMRVDGTVIAERLAAALRFRTVSFYDRSRMDVESFHGLHRYLQTTYRRLHAGLSLEKVAELSLLYTWPGRDRTLRPIILMAHQDVVPIEEASAADWAHPPFAGTIAEGYVWGRGALDNKVDVICILEAVEALIAEGFVPERTVYLSFGHDEEVGGHEGAQAVAELLRSRDVELELVLDEGGGFATDGLPALGRPIAPIAIAEKGGVSFELVVEGKAGHSSIPPRHTAPGILASAIHRLERNPVPGGLRPTTRRMLEFLAPELPFGARLLLGNLWLFGPILPALASRNPILDAFMRTTTAVTIFRSGVKANVIPAEALAVVNHRILPGDTVESVREHVRRTIDDPRIMIDSTKHGVPRNPSPISRIDTEAFAMVQRTVAEVLPEAVLIPVLSPGGTDARHFYGLSESTILTYLKRARTLASEKLPTASGSERAWVSKLANVEFPRSA